MSTPARGMTKLRGRQLARGIVSLTLGTLTLLAIGCSSGQNASILRNGQLRVTMLPAAAVNAGARWTVDGGATQYTSGTTLNNLSIGNHTVRFTAVAGYTTPAAQTVSVQTTPVTTVTGTYVAGGGGGVTDTADAVAPDDLAITLPTNQAALPGNVAPNTATAAWTMVSSSTGGTVTFANPAGASTTATFSRDGVYVLRLTATNGAASDSDTVTVTVNNPPPANQPPAVTAPATVAGVVGQPVRINGTVTDDGLPAARAVTISWQKQSGPGSVTFNPTNAAVTDATFSQEGTYVVRLNAGDGALQATPADVTATISPVATSTIVCSFTPTSYTVGQSVSVELDARPQSYSQTVENYTVVEVVPAGWTVDQSSISHNGQFNTTTGQIRWAFTSDSDNRVLTYRATPTTGVTGVQEFGLIRTAPYPRRDFATYTLRGGGTVEEPVSGWRRISPAS
ncbi:MAG: PKD domain-containing protein [Fimbriimonadaceae bacterium]|nr:PKD domain-containing protein [Fimbriimonadaceae bacterium]